MMNPFLKIMVFKKLALLNGINKTEGSGKKMLSFNSNRY